MIRPLTKDHEDSEASWRLVEGQIEAAKKAGTKRKHRVKVSAQERTDLFSLKAFAALSVTQRNAHTWSDCKECATNAQACSLLDKDFTAPPIQPTGQDGGSEDEYENKDSPSTRLPVRARARVRVRVRVRSTLS